MKKGILLVLCIIFTLSVYSQNAVVQTIRGTVRDKETQEPLPGVNVFIVSINKVAQTDIDGKFKISDVPVGRVDLKLNMMGYEELNLNGLQLGSGKELVLNIDMNEKFIKTQEITITADRNISNNEMATVSARSFSVEETKRYAASVNDPARMALSYAGVANNGDFDNGIVIRGNAPRGLLWRLEGIEIPNPNHFGTLGASGGAISMMSANTMSNSDFYVGAFPADYGNALSGVFDIKLRNGNDQKREYAVQMGVLGMDVSAEGPFGKSKASYLVNYRYSTLAVLEKVGVKIAGDAVPVFQDLTWKVNMPTKKAGTFTFFGLTGDNNVKQSDTNMRFTNSGNLLTSGLSHLYLFNNNKTYLKTIFSYSRTSGKSFEEDIDSAKNYFEMFSQNSVEDFYRVSTFVNHKFNVRHTLRVGAILTQMKYNVKVNFFDYSTDIYTTYYDEKGSTSYYQGYAQYKFKPIEKITLTGGVHANLFALNNSYSIEPRLGFQYDMNGANTITAGVGVHSRLESIGQYFVNVRQADSTFRKTNTSLEASKAFHAVVGYKHQINEFTSFKVETYYQHMYDIPVSIDSGSTFSLLNFDGGLNDIALRNSGTGTNYGIELTLERPLKNNIYYLITASLFNSTYENFEGKTFNSRFNSNYLLNVLVGKEFRLKENNFLGVNVRTIYAGGIRNTPIDLNASIAEGNAVYDDSKAYTLQNPAYFRPDIRFSYKINKKKASHEISLDLQNAINRMNVFTTYYDENEKNLKTAYQTGLIPILNYRIEF